MVRKLAGAGSVYALLVIICHLTVYILLQSLTPLKTNSEMCTFGTLVLVWLCYDYYLPTSIYH